MSFEREELGALHSMTRLDGIYRIKKIINRARSARTFSLRRPVNEGIIRLNAPFYCFRTSRSLLWLLKWSKKIHFYLSVNVF